jgi:hypothetical protein
MFVQVRRVCNTYTCDRCCLALVNTYSRLSATMLTDTLDTISYLAEAIQDGEHSTSNDCRRTATDHVSMV